MVHCPLHVILWCDRETEPYPEMVQQLRCYLRWKSNLPKCWNSKWIYETETDVQILLCAKTTCPSSAPPSLECFSPFSCNTNQLIFPNSNQSTKHGSPTEMYKPITSSECEAFNLRPPKLSASNNPHYIIQPISPCLPSCHEWFQQSVSPSVSHITLTYIFV